MLPVFLWVSSQVSSQVFPDRCAPASGWACTSCCHTALSLLLSRQVLWALWGHNWLPHGGFGWSAGLREGTLPISGPEDQHPCSCPAPPCVAKGPTNYCPGGSLPIITHLSALLILSPLTLGNSRDPCLPPGGG